MSDESRGLRHSALRTQHSPGLWSRAFALACLANFTTFMAAYVLLGTVTLYAVHLGVPEAQVGWFLGCISVFGLGSQVVGGRLLGHCRRTLLLRLGPLIIALGSLLALAVPTPPALLGVCALFATGYGLLQSAAVVLVAETAPPRRRGQAIGLYGTFTTLAVVIGPASGIELLRRFGGGPVFLLTLAMALAALGCALLVRDPPPRYGATAEASARLHPLVYFAALALFGMTATWGAITAFLPLYALGLGLANPGLYFTVQALAVLSLRMATGGLSDRFGRVQVLVPATALLALGVWGLALRPPVPLLLLLALLYGVGYSAIHPTTMAVADEVSTRATRGTAIGLVGGAFSTGLGAGAVSMGYVLQHSSYETMFFVAGWIPLVATGLFVWCWRTSRQPPAIGGQATRTLDGGELTADGR